MRRKLDLAITTAALLVLTINLGGCPAPSETANPNDGNPNPAANPADDQASNQAGGSGNANRAAPITHPVTPTLFVADSTYGIVSFAEANTKNGNIAPTTHLNTLLFPPDLGQPWRIVVDRTGALVVHETTAPALLFYARAATATNDEAPSRKIQGLSARLAATPGGMAVDRDNDRVFVATSDRVLIFEGATLSARGDTAPTRFFSSVDLPSGGSIALGPNGDLYANDAAEQTVVVFSNAGTRSGEIRAERVIDPKFLPAEAIFVDHLDRLYVVSSNTIGVFEQASTLTGEIEADRTMELAGVRAIGEEVAATPCGLAITVDSRGIGYFGDHCNGAIHVIDSIGTRSGAVRADRAITGPATEFSSPTALFMWE